jgi:parallel beta-helix repeat protein
MVSISKTSAIVFIVLIIMASVLTIAVIKPYVLPKTLLVPNEYASIQSAVDDAKEGDTILIKNGIYNFGSSEQAVIKKSLTLMGENSKFTIIDGQAQRSNDWGSQTAFLILASNVIVKGLTFQHFANTVISIGTSGIGCKIIDNNFMNNYGEAVSTQGNYNVISGNYLVNNEGGIDVSSLGTSVYDNLITDNDWGVIVQNNGYNQVHNNVISSNREGIELRMGTNFKVYENQISENTHSGVYLDILCYNSEISSNEIRNNSIGIEENTDYAQKGSGNLIYDNNLVDNSQQVFRSGNATTAYSWNNSKVGNYWSDYHSRYPNSSEIDSSGIGNTPYAIDFSNSDYHPILRPIGIHPTETLLRNIAIVVIISLLGIVSLLLYRRHRKLISQNNQS